MPSTRLAFLSGHPKFIEVITAQPFTGKGSLSVSIPSDHLLLSVPVGLILPRCRRRPSERNGIQRSCRAEGTCVPASTQRGEDALWAACLSERLPATQTCSSMKRALGWPQSFGLPQKRSHKVCQYPHIGSIVPVKGLASLIRSIVPFYEGFSKR